MFARSLVARRSRKSSFTSGKTCSIRFGRTRGLASVLYRRGGSCRRFAVASTVPSIFDDNWPSGREPTRGLAGEAPPYHR